MSINRADLVRHMRETSAILLEEKGYVSFVEVLMRMGRLTKEDHDAWRFGRTRCLENVITLTLAKIGLLLRSFSSTRIAAICARARPLIFRGAGGRNGSFGFQSRERRPSRKPMPRTS